MASKKTIKKVEAPIDQHETFVSLQKSFADSDLSVEEKLRTLYELQKADSEIDNILQLRGELPREVEALEEEIAQMKVKSAEISALVELCAGIKSRHAIRHIVGHSDIAPDRKRDPGPLFPWGMLDGTTTGVPPRTPIAGHPQGVRGISPDCC